MNVSQMALPGCLLIAPRVFPDERGFFFESYNEKTMSAIGIGYKFVQDNCSYSKKNVLRGLHYQIMQPQGKLVRVMTGQIFDVAVDLRRSSPHFCKWVGVTLSAENRNMLWIPPGFAHGFAVLSDEALVLYKATEFYAANHERTVVWNDPDLNIDWPIKQPPIMSDKDLAGVALRNAEMFD